MSELRLVDALVSALRDWGVGDIFGVSGANIEHVHDAIHRLGGSELRAVLARSESGAAFMADGRARVHRTLGVCCCTSGGGMMNLAVGIAESYAESVPVLALVGQPPSALAGRGGFQDSSGIGRTVDAAMMWQAMSKHTVQITAAGFWSQLHRAVRTALSGRPGPSILLLPRDTYDQLVAPRPADWPTTLAELTTPMVADDGPIEALFAAMSSARRPVIVLGTGAERAGAGPRVAAFARQAGIPVVTTMASSGSYPNSDPGYLGMIGVAGHPSAHDWLNTEADLIVAVGSGLNIMTRAAIGPALARATLAVVNVDTRQLDASVSPSLVVQGDALVVFDRLSEILDRTPMAHALPHGYRLSRFVPRLADPDAESEVACADTLLQSEAIAQLQGHLPACGHVLFDAGNCAAAALHHLQIPDGTTTTIALGMGGMGYAIAASIGAQSGSSAGTRSVVLCGDGAFLMAGFEVHTAVQLGLSILYVVFNNNQHGMCVTRQKLYFEGRLESTAYPPLDVATVCRGLGTPDRLWVGSAGTAAALTEALAAFARSPVPTGVLELRLPREEIPPFTPFLGADAEVSTAPSCAA
ncbi:MAG: acetolactate synthase-1/2/3 large subunit [Myxococcota bacterium]